jgi:LysW-gamma-L-lysine carboxypeptidase
MMNRQPQVHALSDTRADNLLTGLVERYSPSRQERAAVTFLVEQMRALGFRSEADGAGNAVGEIGDGKRTILLLGHIDTVPGYIDVRREGSLLYGRGTVDAKGPLAAFVAAASRVGAQSSQGGRRIMVVGAVEEEAATSKGARYLLDRVSPDAVVIGEPSAWDRITVGYKGRLLVDYVLSREVGHTAGPDRGACEEAVGFWQRVVDYAWEWNVDRRRMLERLNPSLRRICSESDGFVERVAMTVGLRLPLEMDIDSLQDTLLALAEDAELRFRGREVAVRVARNTRLARAFIKAIRAQGGQPVFKVKSGTSDMNVVSPVWRCQILAYGPGDATLDHTPHEHIDLNEYHRSIEVLTRVLKDL